ncbi:hypothetical protein FHR23_001948 [Stakelama sediminis]|uniref:Uncharacterized protein n=1 Tax=Stakelama sediminis TaxID=463200 RepID=A0A840YZS5_9SPHN|nr:hypothetical protein [Stakelama sediminis]MBB5719010.1 hypothetical protein [Stakelama sediminis]
MTCNQHRKSLSIAMCVTLLLLFAHHRDRAEPAGAAPQTVGPGAHLELDMGKFRASAHIVLPD